MKQIALKQNFSHEASVGPCSGRLFLVWGAYGAAMAWLWQAAGQGDRAHAAVWALALAAGIALALALKEG